MTLGVVLICVLLVVCSAALSASETSLFSLSRYQIRNLRDRAPRAFKTIKRLISDPAGLLGSILITNEIINISISTLIANAVFSHGSRLADWLVDRGMAEWAAQTLVGTLATTPVILLLCEVTPKAIGARANQTLAILLSTPIGMLYDVLKPFRSVARAAMGVAGFRASASGARDDHGGTPANRVQEEDILVMAEEGTREGSIHETELDLIRNVFELDDTPVAEIQTPFSQVTTVSETLSVRDALRLTQTWRFSRIPVLSRDRKRVTGVLYRKDLLLSRLSDDPSALTVSDVMRKPLVVQNTTKLNSVFRKLKQHQTHIAIVEGPNQVPTGVVTMADVLGELFEDLFEELEE